MPPSASSISPSGRPRTSSAAATTGAVVTQPTFIDEPTPLPFHEDDNTDAMALRAAISILQVQKEKSKRDLRTIQKLKQAATERPELFVQQLLDGELQPVLNEDDPLAATFASASDADDDDDDDDDKVSVVDKPDFARIPAMQTIFRCPPINWAKYHVVGDALNKMHQEQLTKPSDFLNAPEARPIATPYSPFHDQLPKQRSVQGHIAPPKPD